MKKTILITLAILSSGLSAFAGKTQKGFAIIVDSKSYSACKADVEAYAASVREDGWKAFVSARDWESPEQVKDSLKKWYAGRGLAGAVFVGDIPVPMIRGAQHLTSAFKMDENSPHGYGMRDTSVPSDRFYDDFDLKFDFIKRDSTETRFFYYRLSPVSPQEITCDIFTGRITPSAHYQDRYAELSKYLRKVVRVRAQDKDNKLDHIASYTGAGSFSDSMIAWKDEGTTLQEQVPDAFRNVDGARFFVFYQYPYIKDTLLRVAGKKDLDLFLFHHHGTPERQWIQNQPHGETEEEVYESGRLMARGHARRLVRYGKTREEAVANLLKKYPEVDSVWFTSAFDPEVEKADSIQDLKVGILLDDVHNAEINARFCIFDACYNGDFREEDYIANRYIMGDGDAVAGCGNSVNVLQDKHSSHLLGLLTQGWTVGEWHAKTAILESHIIGDPTYRFAESSNKANPDLKALKLKGMSPKALLEEYRHSDSYMYRLEVLKEIMHFDAPEAYTALREALDDPYEYIRRKAATYLSMRGAAEDVPALAEAYINDRNSKRVAFNIANDSGFFPDSLFLETYRNKVKEMDFIFDRPDSVKTFVLDAMFTKVGESEIKSAMSFRDYFAETLADTGNAKRGRLSIMRGLRNMPFPDCAATLIGITANDAEPMNVRIAAAEILGWYTHAGNRKDIIAKLSSNIETGSLPEEVKQECVKTVARLKAYTK